MRGVQNDCMSVKIESCDRVGASRSEEFVSYNKRVIDCEGMNVHEHTHSFELAHSTCFE
jgi:hypothetical protein